MILPILAFLQLYLENNFTIYSYNLNVQYLSSKDILDKYDFVLPGEKSLDVVNFRGRVMKLRYNRIFMDCYDADGKIQIYTADVVQKPNLGDCISNLILII